MAKQKQKVIFIRETPGILGGKPSLDVQITDCSVDDAIRILSGVLAALNEQRKSPDALGPAPKVVSVPLTGFQSVEELLRVSNRR